MNQEISVTMKFSSFEAFAAVMAKLHPTAAETVAVVQPKVEATPPAEPPTPPADPADHVNLAEPKATTGRRRRKAADAPAPVVAPAAPVEPTPPAPAAPAVATNLFDTPPAATAAAPVAETPAAPNPNPSIDECRKALSDVNDRFGMSVAHSMLGEVGAERISLIPEGRRAEFVANCKAKVAVPA